MSVDSISAPSTLAKKVLTGPLRLVTLCSDDIDDVKAFYESELSLNVIGPIEIGDVDKLRSYYGIPDNIDIAIYQIEPEHDDDQVHIRVINISESTPAVKSSHDAREVGLLMINKYSKSDGQRLKSPDHFYWNNNTTQEVSFNGNEDYLPTYPTITFITDQAEEDLTFFTHILGMDLLSDATNMISKVDLPGLTSSTVIREICLQSKTGTGSILKLVSFDDEQYKETVAAPRLPNQGITMCSFETTDIGEVLARAHAKQIKVYRTPRKMIDPILGAVIAMSLLGPTGFIIEVYSRL